MKNLKLLNKKKLSIILFFLFFGLGAQSNEPVDIWETETNKPTEEVEEIKNSKKKDIQKNSIYEMQSEKNNHLNIQEDPTLISKEVEIIGLYDPEENGLDINMWLNSDGDQILNILNRIDKIKLSEDASEILNILLLTNSHYPGKNISKEKFLDIKSDWLIKNSNLKLIKEYVFNNQIDKNEKLLKYMVDYYLSRSEVKKSCEIFSNIKKNIEDEYLSKFNIYCLINDNRRDEAQLLIDLKKETGFVDKFFEKKINYLMDYDNKPEITISEKNILNFHLSHRTNPEFKFIPKNSTSKEIWKYLSTSNLLDNIKDIELTDQDKISTIEKATHEKNYTEIELFELYKRFKFNISQLINIKDSSKLLSTTEARALIYQGILITTEVDKKFELMNALKNSFKNDDIEDAFNQELRKFLLEINPEEVPANYKFFYEKNIDKNTIELTNIKINNKILHQSKLINYFLEETSAKNITKDLNDFLKKIKRDKKYYFSKKDVILVEALKSDNIKILEKYSNLYEVNELEIPSDIQVSINNGDMATAMLRIVEVIGQDQLKDIDEDTMYFIISTLNQLNIDKLRNKILLKVLPLKV